jgi:DNA-binding transcriptional LysR family regulator
MGLYPASDRERRFGVFNYSAVILDHPSVGDVSFPFYSPASKEGRTCEFQKRICIMLSITIDDGPMRSDVDAELLRAFVAVADRGGFTRAARTLNRTQSAVSMQIKRLEAVTRAALFERLGRSIRLTQQGEALLGYARRILDLNDEALQSLTRAHIEGPVRIGAMDDYGTRCLPQLIARFCADHPHVSVELHTGLTTVLVEQLGSRFELVLAMHPVGSRRGEVLRREATVWAGSRTHTTHERDPLPLALAPQGCLFRDWAMGALDKAKRPWRLAYMSPSLGAAEAAAQAGLAVTVVKASMMPASLRALGRREGLPKLPAAEIALHRAPRSRPSSAVAAARLGDFIVESLRDGSARML